MQKAHNPLNQKNTIKCYSYLARYEKEVKENGGQYNIEHIQDFLADNDIYLETLTKNNMRRAVKHNNWILFEQNKRNKSSKDDVAHHLLRHIRNSIAHVYITKYNGDIHIEDYQNNRKTMQGKISEDLFFLLIDKLISTKNTL